VVSLVKEDNIFEKLPMYRTCGIRLGSHLKSVATAMTILFLTEWNIISRRHNRRTWQLPLTGLIHHIGLASPSYQQSLMDKCLSGEEIHADKTWITTVSIISYASCSISSTVMRRALGDAARAIATAFANPANRFYIEEIKHIASKSKKSDLQDIASYAYFILYRNSKSFGIPQEISEAFKIKNFSPLKVSRCIERTLNVKNDVSNKLSNMLKIADELVTSIENSGLTTKKFGETHLYRELAGKGTTDPWSLIRYIDSRIQRFYKTFSSKSGAAC
jgi:hypothetical protein